LLLITITFFLCIAAIKEGVLTARLTCIQPRICGINPDSVPEYRAKPNRHKRGYPAWGPPAP